MSMHLSTLLSQRAAHTPNREALVSPEGAWSFAEFEQRTQRLAAYFERNGVVAGDRIAVCAKNSELTCCALFAAAHLNATLVVMNWRLNASELDYVLHNSKPVALLSQAAFSEVLAPLVAEQPSLLLIGSGEGALGESYEAIQADDTPVQRKAVQPNHQAPAAIMYTSGTTGRPKGAMLPHRGLISAAQSSIATLNWSRDDRFLLVAPLFHIGGLSPLVTGVLKGNTSVLLPDFDPATIWDIIARERITSLMCVPVMLQAMFDVAQSQKVDSSSLVWVLCGAAFVPQALIHTGQALNIAVQQVYGITEFCGPVTFWTPEMGLAHANSHGQVIIDAELKIVDPTSLQTLPTGQDGEIWCRGDMVFSGYWDNTEATAEVLQDGWYRTGDVGRLDDNGFLYLMDRLKDMIISGGENIYPAELEAVLEQLEGVAEVAVAGRPDERWGEVPVAFVVRKPGVELSEEQVIQACRDQLASYKCVKAVEWLDALPRSPVGKVLRRELVKR